MYPDQEDRIFTLLELLENEAIHTLDEYRESLIKKFDISESEQTKKQETARNPRILFKVDTARDVSILTDLQSLEHTTTQGEFKITKNGLKKLYFLRVPKS